MSKLDFEFKIMPYQDPKFLPKSAWQLEHTDGSTPPSTSSSTSINDDTATDDIFFLYQSEQELEEAVESIYQYERSYFRSVLEPGIMPDISLEYLQEIPTFCINL